MPNNNDPLFRGKAAEPPQGKIIPPRGMSGVTESENMRIAKIHAAATIVAAAYRKHPDYQEKLACEGTLERAASYLRKVFEE